MARARETDYIRGGGEHLVEELSGLLAQTRLCDPSLRTDLGDAFEAHLIAHRAEPALSLGCEPEWLNLVRDRAQRTQDPELLDLTNNMLALLCDPQAAGPTFKADFRPLYDAAGRRAYPLVWAIRAEIHGLSGITTDYTLQCFDTGMLRVIEDEAVQDPYMKKFVNEMRRELQAASERPGHKVYPKVFEIYSEALVYQLLKEGGGGRLRIEKIAGGDGPDFACALATRGAGGEPREMTFYVEVKALDIVNPIHRLPEMQDEGVAAQIEIERQQRAGKKVALAEQEIAPYRRDDDDADYDPRSLRMVIERLIRKAAGNFKASQFRRGPTFALANLLRLPLPGQAASGLAPFYYDSANGGACVSGVLWHMAFGQVGAAVHRRPEFEGAGTDDGALQSAGLLVDPAIQLPAAGLILLHYEDGAYRLDGLYDAHWTDSVAGWSNVETEEVLYALCGDYNDRSNEMAHKYALYRRRAERT